MRLRTLYTPEELASEKFVEVNPILITELREHFAFLPYRFEFHLGVDSVIPISFLMQSLDTMNEVPVEIGLLHLVQTLVSKAPYDMVKGIIEDFLCFEPTQECEYWHILSQEELQSLLEDEDDDEEDSLFIGMN